MDRSDKFSPKSEFGRGAWPRPLSLLIWLVDAALLLALFVFLRPVLVWLLGVASPFFVALIVAYIFNPIVLLIQRRFRVSRAVGVLITYALILGLVVASLALLVPPLVAQLRMGLANVLDRIPLAVAFLSEQLHSRLSPGDIEQLRLALEGRLSLDHVASQLSPTLRSVVTGLVSSVTSLSQTLAAVVAYSLGFIVFLVLVLMITFYCLVDFGRIGRVAMILIPPSRRERVLSIWSKIDVALGGFLRGQLIVCVIIGVLYSLALIALGMKHYAVLIGFAAGFGNLIPYVGPVIGAVPTMLWVVFGGAYTTAKAKIIGVLVVLAVSVAIQTLDGFFLQPRIVGKNAGLHPLVVLAALIVGSQFGLGGLVLAVPLAIVVRVLVRELWWNPLAARRTNHPLPTTPHHQKLNEEQPWQDSNLRPTV